MKKQYLFILPLTLAISAFAWFAGCRQETRPLPAAAVKAGILRQIDSMQAYLGDSLLPAATAHAPAATLQRLFLQTRLLYKRIEWITEYFMPGTTRFFNGPPLPEVEAAENKITDPEGLQVLETLLFPDTSDGQAILRQVSLLQANAGSFARYLEGIDFSEAQVFDAARLQVFRIITLGITGFDAALAQNSLPEARESLAALQRSLAVFEAAPLTDTPFIQAIRYLDTARDFNGFDRLAFISRFANPLSRALALRQSALSIPLVRAGRLLRPEAATLFDPGAFDVNAYTPDSSYYISEAKTALGRYLFSSTLLSGTNSRSCASCHQPGKAFTDGLAKSATLDGRSQIRRNAPTLLNAALQPAQFYDLRATILENQAMTVVANRDEMHGSMTDAARQLWKDSSYRRSFQAVFPDAVNSIQPFHIQHALASYIRSLVQLNSRFDAYMQGDTAALSPTEQKGFNLFMGKAKCGTCHFMPLFNGTVPPAFLKIETEVIGVPDISLKKPDPDEGRYDMYQLEPFRHAFKTSTVRNSARTAPYMHNGVFGTLEEVIDFYNKGGGTGLGFTLANQTLPFDQLQLNTVEKQALIAFLQSLDSR